jgi:ADP-ribose pyrophosphatase YjhB (NUDIX family)
LLLLFALKIVREFRDHHHKKIKKVLVTIKEYVEAIEQVKKQFKVIKAAGGIVTKENKILLISRLNKWDLPKGKLNKNEKVEKGALREVEEECNIQIRLGKKIGSTWHAYTTPGGKKMLKKTTWFIMKCVDDSAMQPQVEEQITDVKWMSKTEAKRAVANSYGSIQSVINKFFEKSIGSKG